MENEIDYFERYDLLPRNIYEIINKVTELKSYDDTKKLLSKVEKLGWTFDYYLDNIPHRLRPKYNN
tara:strand:+ start:403 stop:600 length:198 start_codon:yes stop_codon:yes gene_type:complete